jgi:hypothetical protein
LQSSKPAAAAGEGGSRAASANLWRHARTITIGTTAAGANVPDGPWNKGDHDLGIGNQTQHLGGRRQWDGILDEARVMRVPRSRSWARLDYESQRQAPTLLKFGENRTK